MANNRSTEFARRATIRDVAAYARVSMMTVSRVVNGSPLVTVKTRSLVNEAIHALGYQPDAIARSMRSQRTRTVGFILPDLTNITNATVAQAIESDIMSSGYQLLIASTQFQREKELGALALMKKQRVAAVVLLLTDETDKEVLAAVESLGIPAVVLDRDVPILVDSVLSTHREPMSDAIHYLLGLGHRRIATILPSNSIRAGRLRREAYIDTMRDAGMSPDEILVAHGQSQISEGCELAQRSLTKHPRPTALILGTNQLTLGAMQAVRKLGLRVPEDLSVIGSDDIVTSALLTPPLTILWRDMAAFGREAARTLIERLESREPVPQRSTTLPTELILRRSCAPPG